MAVMDASGVGEARRAAMHLATEAALDEDTRARLALVVTELGNNLVRHAGSGDLSFHPVPFDGPGVDVLSVDRGPGMEDVDRCLRDGFSTAGGPGTGLGAVRRTSSRFEILSTPGKGTALACRIAPRARQRPPWDMGVLNVPHPGEDVSGDSWGVVHDGSRSLFLLADGLGHGPAAAKASQTVVDSFFRHASRTPAQIVAHAHEETRGTRGAAVGLLEVDTGTHKARFIGVGNVVCSLVPREGRTRSLVSTGGIVGHSSFRCREESADLEAGALVVMHTDGVSQRWSVADYPGLHAHSCELIAGTVFRDWGRERDDACVLVARAEPKPEPEPAR